MRELKCENCKYFHWEDSVWGYCKRFPPKEIMKKWFPKPKYNMEYPEVLCENSLGVDFAIKIKWYQRLIVWLGFKKRWWDYSCATLWKKERDGTYTMIGKKDL